MTNEKVELQAVETCNLCGTGECSHSITADGWQIQFCKECGLGRTDPRPAGPSLGQCYGEDYWQMGIEGEQYEQREIRRLLYRYGRRVRYLQRFKKGGKLLEIGTGFGFFLEAARRRGFDVQGVEISAYVAEQARTLFKLPVENMAAHEFDPGDNKYDVIVLWHVLEHLTDPLTLLKRVRTWLNKDGIFGVEVPHCSGVDAVKGGEKWEGWMPPYHLWHYTPAALERSLAEAGFTVLGTKYGRSTYVRHQLKRYPVIRHIRCLVDGWFPGNWVRMIAAPK